MIIIEIVIARLGNIDHSVHGSNLRYWINLQHNFCKKYAYYCSLYVQCPLFILNLVNY